MRCTYVNMPVFRNKAWLLVPITLSFLAWQGTKTTRISAEDYERKMPTVMAALRREFKEYNFFEAKHEEGRMVITIKTGSSPLPIPSTQTRRGRALNLEEMLKERAQVVLDRIKRENRLSVESINFNPTDSESRVVLGDRSALRYGVEKMMGRD